MSQPELKINRQPMTLVEIDQNQCQLSYGVSPCTAEVGVTGSIKCYNTHKTCQDPDNYDRGIITLTFSEGDVDHPITRAWIPLLQSVNTVPTQINVGGGDRSSEPLGQRADITAVFRDAPYSDLLVDPYRDERDFNPLERGTFWSKWMRRNPYHQNRRMRVREGYVGQEPEEMRTRHYFIDRVTGPDARGRVTVKAKDVLKLADNDRAQWPEQSPGQLNADINETDTSMDVANASISDYDPDGDGAGTVRLGDEIILWDGISESGGIVTLSSLSRGQERTDPDEHDEGDTVQRCQRYIDTPIIDVLQDILVKGSSVPEEFIPVADWEFEAERWLGAFSVSTLLSEPYGATELLAEVTEQCLFYIFWDCQDQEIKLRAIRPVDLQSGEVIYDIDDTNHVLAGSYNQEELPDQRISQVWTLFRQIDPTEDVDEFGNYRRVRILADANAESADQYGESRVRRVYARWLVSDAQAISVNGRILARYRNNPVRVNIDLDAKDRAIKVGDIIDLRTRQIVDETGAEEVRRYQVIRVKEIDPGHRQRYTLQSFEFFGRYAFVMYDDAPDYSDATIEQVNTGGFIAPDTGQFTDGTEAYRLI